MLAVCLPALNEAETIGNICEAISKTKWDFEVDLVVVDGGSTDKTVEIATEAGARIVGPPAKPGKGAALYESVLKTEAEIIVWCDADLTSFTPEIISKLADPLLQDPSLMLVKGFYTNRKLGEQENAGGRTSWLVARPILSLLFKDISHIKEPLSGEYSIRRMAAEKVPFVCGYGVEIGLLIDIARKFGVEAIGEVDLGTRQHRNRPLEDLSTQAMEILQTALFKAGMVEGSDTNQKDFSWSETLHRSGFENAEVLFQQCPPIKSD